MNDLTSGQIEALRDLARKRDGESVPFVNIADARALTELGRQLGLAFDASDVESAMKAGRQAWVQQWML